jgi:hypothetical protein
MSEIKREEREEDIDKEEEPKEETKDEETFCYSSPEPLHIISKPVEVQFDMPVHAQIFMPQHIAELVIQEPLLDVTRAATGAVIYDGLIHKQQCGCIMS